MQGGMKDTIIRGDAGKSLARPGRKQAVLLGKKKRKRFR